MTANPEKIWAVFTGDALFIGETGRIDLPDRNKTAENAGILYDVLLLEVREITETSNKLLYLPAF